MIYLDNAATTALDAKVLEAMLPYLKEQFGNASSVHTLGRDARMGVERARLQVATALGAQAKDIIFTSSASEANNLAIKGVVESVKRRIERKEVTLTGLPEIVASPIEHPCVMESLRHVEALGWAKIIWLPVTEEGLVSVDDVKRLLTENTILVSVMYVNNEIGTIQPIKGIGGLVRQTRWTRLSKGDERSVVPLYFHCDAVQAVQYLECDVNILGVDLLSITGHKLYGPKGAGVLYLRDGVQFIRQIDGGGQEYYKRAGTENVAGIIGLGEAVSKLGDKSTEYARLQILQKKLIYSVTTTILGAHLTGHPTLRAPHITSFIFENVDGEALIAALDREGLAVSSGSACSSGVVRQSHVIESLSLTGFEVKNSAVLRISMGKNTIESDINTLLSVLPPIVHKLRELNL